jgi:hypothetical protein
MVSGVLGLSVTYLGSMLLAELGTAWGDAWREESPGGMPRPENHRSLSYNVPLVGAFMRANDADREESRLFWNVAGAGQVAGVVLFALGVMMRRPVAAPGATSAVTVTPMQLGKGTGGLGLNGTF